MIVIVNNIRFLLSQGQKIVRVQVFTPERTTKIKLIDACLIILRPQNEVPAKLSFHMENEITLPICR